MFICMYMCVCVSMCVYLCMCMYVYVCVCLYVCMCMYVSMYVGMYCICVFLYVHVYVYVIFIYVCVYICTCVYLCMYKWENGYNVYRYMYIRTYDWSCGKSGSQTSLFATAEKVFYRLYNLGSWLTQLSPPFSPTFHHFHQQPRKDRRMVAAPPQNRLLFHPLLNKIFILEDQNYLTSSCFCSLTWSMGWAWCP